MIMKTKKKKRKSLKKQVKNKEKEQASADRLKPSLAAKESERNVIGEKLKSTKPLVDLKERKVSCSAKTRKTGRSFKIKAPRNPRHLHIRGSRNPSSLSPHSALEKEKSA